jgi:lipoprotein NlpI
MKIFLTLALGVVLGLSAARAAEPASWPEWRAPMLEKFADELKTLDAALVSSPDAVPILSQRGDRHLFLGHFPQAVADYERMIALDASQDAPHWRLGIAYYFTGQFAKSAKQFEKYHAYDGHDRENGIWKFLAQEKADGLEKARAEMLSYTKFDREPFPSLYEMFAGQKSPAELLAEITRKGLEDDTQVVFFGNYYAGLDEAILGHRARGLELLEKAVSLPQARAGGGPGYMWQVARLHWERLRAENAQR